MEELSPCLSTVEKARHIAYEASEEISLLILEFGQEQVKAQHASGIALDQRCAAFAAIQMTAVAIALAYLVSDKATDLGRLFGVLSCATFLLGAVASFYGIRSGHQKLPGLPPAYWYRTDEFKEDAARCYAAGEIQDAIDYNEAVNAKKGDALNLSLLLAAIGLLLILAAGVSQAAA